MNVFIESEVNNSNELITLKKEDGVLVYMGKATEDIDDTVVKMREERINFLASL